jgi:hypothetical protein
MVERWKQACRAGEVTLDSFTPAELDCVTLDPGAVPDDVRGPALQAVAPLLAQLAAERDSGAAAPAAGWDSSGGAPVTESDSADAGPGAGVDSGDAPVAGWESAEGARNPALAAAAADLERRGYLRPGFPARPDVPVPGELAGWSVHPDGQGAELRPVAIGGDLGIITRMRSQPYWVTEVSTTPEPTQPELGARVLVARLYAVFRPRGAALVERPSAPGGQAPPFILRWEAAVLQALVAWCGVDLGRFRPGAPVDFGQLPDAPTADVCGRFGSLVQLRVARRAGERVLLSRLLVASGEGRHWILEGERAERAVNVSTAELANRIVALLRTPADRTGAAEDGWDRGPGGL